eukprot:TRINITY_DN2173_c0_g3_i1.p1 TRINITY_DN2173_c0_g3~~TRINITY_DN2173_c0_g3_i1.p1  ORF type:complete len:204 (+),score=50.42 TRINITY_DN2173_c0_g3_i1:59-613(+)
MWRIWSKPDLKEDAQSGLILYGFLSLFGGSMIVLLIVLSAMSGYAVSNVTDSSLGYDEYYVSCTLETSGIVTLSLILGLAGLVIVMAAALAFLSRNVSKSFNETPSITLSIYSILVSAAVVVLLFLNTKSPNPSDHMIFIACGTFIAITCPILYLFIPKFYLLLSDASSASQPKTPDSLGSSHI